MKHTALAALFAVILGSDAGQAAVTFDWATVGNPGNAPDDLGLGAVDYAYRISKHEVTNAQYVEFLNAVDPMGTNPNSVYSNSMGTDLRGGITFDSGAASGLKYSAKAHMDNKPVNYVSFFDAMRFVNWLESGQPVGGGGTEGGVYAIGTGTNETRAPGATFFIPSEDEWVKAAYHHPAAQGGDADSYWAYPTASNSLPTVAAASAFGDISNPGANVANYALGADWNGLDGNVTSVGSAGPSSASFYGTFDQGGNVWEWTEAVAHAGNLHFRLDRGGGWDDISDLAPVRNFLHPEGDSNFLGFRVASIIPEPSAGLLGALSMLGLLPLRRRSS